MEKFLTEIEKALEYHLYYIALQSALTLPDICGALLSDNGQANKRKYVNWYEQHFQPKYNLMLSGEDCYYFRCANIHQGQFQHSQSSYDKIAFIDAGAGLIHNNTISINIGSNNQPQTIYTLDISTFCHDLIKAVREWLVLVKDDSIFKKNYANMIKMHSEGLYPFPNLPAVY